MPSEYSATTPNWKPLQLIVCVYSFGTHAKQQEMYLARELFIESVVEYSVKLCIVPNVL